LWFTVNGVRIGTTAEHPFWVVNREQGIEADDLAIGDVLIGHAGQTSVLEGKKDGDWATVYNLRVGECHTCFVGGDKWGFSVWAHNAACTPDEVSKATREVLSTASFRGKGNLRARVVEALRLNDFDQAAAFLQELRGIGPARAEAIIQRLQARAPEAAPAPANPSRGVPDPGTPVGHRGSPLGAVHGNAPTTIGGRQFSGHAIDQMQARGIPPSVVRNTIQHGVPGRPQRVAGRTSHYDPVNNITVITETASGEVVTVFLGR
jgi:hypothetical protein